MVTIFFLQLGVSKHASEHGQTYYDKPKHQTIFQKRSRVNKWENEQSKKLNSFNSIKHSDCSGDP